MSHQFQSSNEIDLCYMRLMRKVEKHTISKKHLISAYFFAFFALEFFVFSVPIFAFDSKLEKDPTINLENLKSELLRANERGVGQVVNVRYTYQGGNYYSDASALISGVSKAKLMAVAADYDHYVEMKMPNVVVSRVVERQSNTLFTFTQMSYRGQVSKHYLEVRNSENAMEWQLTDKQPQWLFDEDSSFARLDGSWYVEKLEDGNTYARYYLSADFSSHIPEFIIRWVARRQFTEGVRQVIEQLANAARM